MTGSELLDLGGQAAFVTGADLVVDGGISSR